MQVREERTGWRDEALSRRHRRWGWDCPAVDIDFLMIEYDRGKALALVEYKNEHAPEQHSSHPTYQAMIDLGNRAGIPVVACRYSSDWSTWTATPLNAEARRWFPQRIVLTERGWVTMLYRLRGGFVPFGLFDGDTLA